LSEGLSNGGLREAHPLTFRIQPAAGPCQSLPGSGVMDPHARFLEQSPGGLLDLVEFGIRQDLEEDAGHGQGISGVAPPGSRGRSG
jgi:hypothetical protein